MATTFPKALTDAKRARLKATMNHDGVIAALAIDQRGAMRKLMGAYEEPTDQDIVAFKKLASRYLTPFTSAILLDPEYGLPAAELRDESAGLLVAYEQTGFDPAVPGRLPHLLPTWSARRLREAGADAAKLLLYYDPDEGSAINDQKHALVERVGAECAAEDMPFFLEIVTYDAGGADIHGPEYARMKPGKVIRSMRELSAPRYGIDVLKVEVPVNMVYVEGYDADGEKPVYSAREAADLFRAQSEATKLPFIFLSAGVSADLFRRTLRFAHDAGSTFNGVLCGRATWADGVGAYCNGGVDAAVQWFETQGRANVEELNAILRETATGIRL